MKASEAASILGISLTETSRILNAGLLEGEKVGGRWVITQDAVDHYQAIRRKPGRPSKKCPVYSLMNGPYEVAVFAFDESDDKGGFDIIEVKDPLRAPIYRLLGDEQGRGHPMFNEWWGDRGIPTTREGIENVLTTLGVGTPDKIHFKNNALSLSDQYWIRPEGSDTTWNEINYFDNDFADDDIAHNRKIGWFSAVGTNSPDNALNGICPKRWIIRNKKRLLVKGHERGLHRQPINELIATKLYERLLTVGQYDPYTLEEDSDGHVSVCECFISKDEEYIPAWHIMKDVFIAGDKTRNPYERFVAHAVRVGCSETDISAMLDRMLVCDFIMANQDRHMGNFGLVRNIHTLEISPAPIFDNGNSLWYAAPSADFIKRTRHAYRTRPFDENPLEQLRFVRDWSWLDLDALNGFPEEAQQILLDCMGDGELADVVAQGISRQISLLEFAFPSTA